ncbi:hypothetical protein LIA77_07535 [Sarocladium implicatum]|nr:hypothetical protein LIA77_07535 [Sarocladium implicatum]
MQQARHCRTVPQTRRSFWCRCHGCANSRLSGCHSVRSRWQLPHHLFGRESRPLKPSLGLQTHEETLSASYQLYAVSSCDQQLPSINLDNDTSHIEITQATVARDIAQ